MKLEQIIKKCIEANPEIVEIRAVTKHGIKYPEVQREIRLADVLLALGDINRPLTVNVLGYMLEYKNEKDAQWNLKDDNLEHQSGETIKFIHNLLKD